MFPKKTALVLLLLAITTTAQAQRYDIVQHTIVIDVDEKGTAGITERFYLLFPRDIYLENFKQESQTNGVSLSAWKQFDSRLHPFIGEETDIVSAQLAFIENQDKYLELTYKLKTPIMHVTSDTTRRTDYRLKENFFRQFFVGSLIIIPDNTSIQIKLPPQAEIQGTIKPDAAIEQNTIILNGYKSSNVIEIQYRVWKQIASFDLQQIMQGLLKSELTVFLGTTAFALLIFVYIKRKTIAQKIEDYIVEHSEIAPEEKE